MKSEFQVEGYWWLPAVPEKRIAGIFSYKPDEYSELKLFGNLHPEEDHVLTHILSDAETPSIIQGEDENANEITLTVLSYGNISFNFSSSFPLIHYKAQYTFILALYEL